MLRNPFFNLLILILSTGPLFSQTTDDHRLTLSHQKRNGKEKIVPVLSGNSVEISLRAPNDSLITFYDRTIRGKITGLTDSTLTLALTESYRYVNYENGSYLEDYFEYSVDSTQRETIRIDSVTCIYVYKDRLNYTRKVSVNLARIFIAVSTINALAGKGGITNSIIFCLGIGAIFGESFLDGKKYWIDVSEKKHRRPVRQWKLYVK